MRTARLLFLLSIAGLGLWGQAFPTSVAGDANLLVARNSAITTLATTVNSMTTTIVLTSGALFANNMVITIGTERIFCPTLAGNTYTGCTRGYDNSTMASHTAGAAVSNFIVGAYHNVLATELKGVEGWLRDGKFNYCSSTTGTDAYACNLSPPISSYTVGARYFVMVDTANTGPATLQLNGIAGPVTIKKQHDQDLVTGDIEAGNLIEVGYDGTYMQMLSQLASGGAAGLGDPGSNGLLSRINLNQTVNRTLQGTTGNVTVSNGDGVSGDPTVDLGVTAVQTDQGNTYSAGLQDFSGVPIRITGGTGAPSSASCDEAGERGSLYARYDNPATNPSKVYLCGQTGAGTYAWQPVGYKVGTTAPAKCDVGDVFFDSDATAGQNWFGCTAADTWNLLGGSGGGLSDPANPGIVVRTTLNSTVPRTLTGTAGNVTVTNGDGQSGNPIIDLGATAVQTDQGNTYSAGMQDFTGVPIRITGGSAAPTSGTCDDPTERGTIYARYDNPASNPTKLYLCGQTGVATYAWQPVGYKVGTTAPAKCDVGDVFFDSDSPAGQNWYGCTSIDTWTLLSGGSGGGSPGGVSGDMQRNAGGGVFGAANINQNADGSLNASKAVTTPNPTTPTFGTTTTCTLSDSLDCAFTMSSDTTLQMNNPHGAGRYAVWATQNGTGGYRITWPGSFINSCQPAPAANALTIIEFRYNGVGSYFITNCSSDHDGVVFGGKTTSYTSSVPTGELVAWFDTTKANLAVKNPAGDVFETVKGIANPSDANCVAYIDVNGVQQRVTCGSVASTTSALKGNGSGGAVAVTGTGSDCVHVDGSSATCGGAGGGTAVAPYVTTVSSQTSVSITAATHGQGVYATPWCFDDATPRLAVACAYTRNTSGDLVFAFSPPFTGQIEIGSGGGTDLTPYSASESSQTSVTITAATHGKGTTPRVDCFDGSTPRVAVTCYYTRASNGDLVFTFSPAFTGIIEVRP